jgi:hypothetical protein
MNKPKKLASNFAPATATGLEVDVFPVITGVKVTGSIIALLEVLDEIPTLVGVDYALRRAGNGLHRTGNAGSIACEIHDVVWVDSRGSCVFAMRQ